MAAEAPLRFGVIGIDHPHAYSMTLALLRAGAQLAAFHSGDPAPAEGFGKVFSMARAVGDPEEILDDDDLPLVASAIRPEDRAELGVLCMRSGKDVLMDKPAAVTLSELAVLREVQADTGRIFAIFYSERLESAATERACRLVHEGAIGRPIHTAGFGPHRLGLARPDWFWDPARSGGILGDLASHQIEQFLFITGANDAEITRAQVANRAHPEAPAFDDFGELMLQAEGASGYARVDWFTPDGLATWGDARLSILGTEGTIEVRKNCDLAGRAGADHLFLVDGAGVRHLDCAGEPLVFAPALLRDVRERSETALPQAHAFRAQELALLAQAQAVRLEPKPAVR